MFLLSETQGYLIIYVHPFDEFSRSETQQVGDEFRNVMWRLVVFPDDADNASNNPEEASFILSNIPALVPKPIIADDAECRTLLKKSSTTEHKFTLVIEEEGLALFALRF